jgi:hypothetical protein
MKRPTFARFFNDDDAGGVLPPASSPPARTPPEPASASPGRVTCEGCGCSLDTRGAIIRRGDGLKAHLDRERELETLTKALDEEREKSRLLSARLAELEPSAKKRGFFY